MDKHVFSKEIKSLFGYFQKHEKHRPPKETLEDWYERLKSLPNKAFITATNELKELDRLPVNIPKAIRNAWFTYLRANPDQVLTQNNYVKCADCNSSGGFLVFLQDSVSKHFHEKLFLCGRCNNWLKLTNDPNLSKVRAENLIKRGYEFRPYNKPISQRQISLLRGKN